MSKIFKTECMALSQMDELMNEISRDGWEFVSCCWEGSSKTDTYFLVIWSKEAPDE